jgi:hypothetical protein
MTLLDRIQIYENFLDQEERERVTYDLSQPTWKGEASSLETQDCREIKFWRINTPSDSFYSQKLFNKIKKLSGKEFVWLSEPRPYFNGQTFSQDASLHKDALLEEAVTFLLYCTENYKPEMGGFTLFKERENEVIVVPKYNRGVLFPATLEHKAFSFSRPWHPLRVSLAFKLKLR